MSAMVNSILKPRCISGRYKNGAKLRFWLNLRVLIGEAVYICENFFMRKIATLSFFLLAGFLSQSQNKSSAPAVARPKLVVGIMIDQMRWDYLYRFQDRFSENGFKRLLKEGMSCENTFIPYAQTVTAVGHTTVYTGSVPAIHGIMGNEWYDKSLGREVYCAEDKSVKLVGVEKGEPMSPANMWATTICDEMRLASNFKSKVIGIAIKDRGGILPAGHSANAAYWYDGSTGKWISSTYYMKSLPGWVSAFNDQKWPDKFYQNDWNTLFPIETYTNSDQDQADYEGKFAHETAPVFPHELKSRIGKDYGTIRSTPYGSAMTLEFSKQALLAEEMGKDAITDFLAISLSSPDYIGHQFGPNSIEIEDNYLRLDRDLAAFYQFLDQQVGKGQYTTFLTADHAVAHVPGFLAKNKIPVKTISLATNELNQKVQEKLGVKNAVKASANYQLYLNDAAIDSAGVHSDVVKKFLVNELNKNPDVLVAFPTSENTIAPLPTSVRDMFVNGYNTKRGGDIQFVLKPGLFTGGKTGTTHGSFNPYDAHIPLLWMGWGIQKGALHREVYMTDIAPTLAALLHIQMPNGAIGKVIPEVIK